MVGRDKNVTKSDIQYADTLENIARAGFHRIILQVRNFSFAFMRTRIELTDTKTTIEPCEQKNAAQ